MHERRKGLDFLLSKASEEIASGSSGADRWYEANRREHERLDALIRVMEDESVPDGTVVYLNSHFEYSPLRRALSQVNPGQLGAGALGVGRYHKREDDRDGEASEE